MSELKDLAWAVHDSVHPPAFQSLTYRVRRRRRRRVALVIATAAVLALVIGLPISRLENTQVAAQSTYLPGDGVSYSPGSDAAGEELVRGPEAEIGAVAVLDPNRWISAWSVCLPSCRYSAVMKWDGVKVAMPVRSKPYQILRRGDEFILLARPELGTAGDVTWPDSFLVRFTEGGPVRTVLRYARPSKTFSTKREVLTESLTPGALDVVNVEKSTLRRLQPAGSRFPVAPVRDDSGRWWILDDVGGSRIRWTDDGKNWQQTTLDESLSPGFLAVSRNGRTILAGSVLPTPNGPARVGLLKMSTDGGATWHTVPAPPDLRADGPVAFDDGTGLLLSSDGGPQRRQLLRIEDAKLTTLPTDQIWRSSATTAPLSDLRGDEDLLSAALWIMPGPAVSNPSQQRFVIISTDRGRTWSSFVPR
ncbi:WD40/YVTN/BNR-like repeat-containing protein [Kribbella sp. NPDC020789]